MVALGIPELLFFGFSAVVGAGTSLRAILATAEGSALRATLRTALRSALGTCVHGFRCGVPCLLEFGAVLVDIGQVLVLDRLLEGVQCSLDGAALVGRNLVAVVLQVLFGLEAESVGVVHLIHALLGLLVGLFVGLGFVAHTLDFVVAKAA